MSIQKPLLLPALLASIASRFAASPIALNDSVVVAAAASVAGAADVVVFLLDVLVVASVVTIAVAGVKAGTLHELVLFDDLQRMSERLNKISMSCPDKKKVRKRLKVFQCEFCDPLSKRFVRHCWSIHPCKQERFAWMVMDAWTMMDKIVETKSARSTKLRPSMFSA